MNFTIKSLAAKEHNMFGHFARARMCVGVCLCFNAKKSMTFNCNKA